MKTYVTTQNRVEGFHRWPDAPAPLAYLANRHRHVFVIKCWWPVQDDDREIEIIRQQHMLASYFADTYGGPAQFGPRSCEMIAKELLQYFTNCARCIVQQDGMGGAEVVR